MPTIVSLPDVVLLRPTLANATGHATATQGQARGQSGLPYRQPAGTRLHIPPMLIFLFSPQGRVSRADYWLRWILPSSLATVAAAVIDAGFMAGATASGPTSTVLTFALVWPNLAITAKRYHDRGMSAWWILWSLLLAIAPLILVFAGTETLLSGNVIGAWVSVWIGLYGAFWVVATFATIVYFLPGQRGANIYGADPLGGKPVRKPKKPKIDPAIEFPGPWTQTTVTRTDRPATGKPSRKLPRLPR